MSISFLLHFLKHLKLKSLFSRNVKPPISKRSREIRYDFIENVCPFDRYATQQKAPNHSIRPFQFALRPMIVAFVEHDISAESANYFECTFPIGSPGLKSGPAFLVAPATRRDHRMPRLIGTLSER